MQLSLQLSKLQGTTSYFDGNMGRVGVKSDTVYRAMRAMDIYLNPNMGPYPKKDKTEIIYVDLVEDSDEARSIEHTDSGTSPGEFNEVSHMSFMTKPELFGIQSGDEQWHDKKGRFKIIKIEPESNQEESEEESTDGIETVVEEETGPEEGEVVIIPILIGRRMPPQQQDKKPPPRAHPGVTLPRQERTWKEGASRSLWLLTL
jgi:hypothetical protein